MQLAPKITVIASDHWVRTDEGKLFARLWATSTRGSDFDGTILLLHDSLGCLELWREFPQLLAAATQRRLSGLLRRNRVEVWD